MSGASAGWQHPRERQFGASWHVAEWVAATVVVGGAVVVGVSLPVLLPVALAGAARVGVIRARGRASHPLGDFADGVREDLRAVVALVVVGALLTALLVGLVLVAGAWPADVRVGVAGAALVAGVLLAGWLAIGLTLAGATRTAARTVPVAALLVATQARRRTGLCGVVLAPAVLVTLLGGDPTFSSLIGGAAFLVAIRVAWPAVERVAA